MTTLQADAALLGGDCALSGPVRIDCEAGRITAVRSQSKRMDTRRLVMP